MVSPGLAVPQCAIAPLPGRASGLLLLFAVTDNAAVNTHVHVRAIVSIHFSGKTRPRVYLLVHVVFACLVV